MPIRHPVAPGTVLLCDYSLGGFRPPEMVKRRPAVVISPRLPKREHLCTVVPLSGTPAPDGVPYQVLVRLDEPLPPPFDKAEWWAKADMLATVGFNRLDFFRTRRDPVTGERAFLHPRLSRTELSWIRQAVFYALAMEQLTKRVA